MELGAGKIAVVTGAGSGIGFALANALASAGCSIVLADVQDDALERATAAIGELGVETLAVRTDVSKADQVEALAQATLDRFGAVHVVCNNAGVAGGGDPWLGPIDGWEWTMGVNFWGVVYGMRTFLPHIVHVWRWAHRQHRLDGRAVPGLRACLRREQARRRGGHGIAVPQHADGRSARSVSAVCVRDG